jgi:HlyD family secretion protein
MRRYRESVTVPLLLLAVSTLAACNKAQAPSAYGNFEATEVVVSAQTSGQLRSFNVTEGATLAAGAVIGVVDTTPIELERATSVANRSTTMARVSAAASQIAVYEAQLDVAKRALDRTQRLYDQKAATAQQRDQAERDYSTLVAQVSAARAQQQSVSKEVAAIDAHVAQIDDRLGRSRVTNPLAGTVLVTYAKAGEMVQPGQALYRIANLDTLVLRAYLVETQLSSVKLGQQVLVHVDQSSGHVLTLPGVVSWISAKAEFTPTPVQTRDERADLVYAVKVLVPNTGGALKIGMPADLDIGNTATTAAKTGAGGA